jgi:glycosyltransferase involved in cell wall biosynthesis
MAFPRKDIPPRQTVRSARVPMQRRVPAGQVFAPEKAKKGFGPGGKFKVLAHTHLYPPNHNAGAEWMLHALLRYGREVRGWDVQVITDHLPARSDSFQGIKVRHDRNINNLTVEYRFSNAIITHLDCTKKAVQLSARAGRPVVHLIHNDSQLRFHKVQPNQCALAVFNSQWLQDAVQWSGRSTILHPPTRVEDYEMDGPLEGERATLLNLMEAKGSATFYGMAARNPAIDFLGVKGSYGMQNMPPTAMANVEIMENQADVLKVYERTRVLLMPSHYESWGRVAVEAACSGIPSICAPTPGLLEAGVAAAYCQPDDIEAWNKALRRLMRSQGAWEAASGAAKERALELDKLVDAQLEETCEMIESL